MQFLEVFRHRLFQEGLVTGYFRTRVVDGKLIGSLLTGDPEGLERLIRSVPELEFIRSERLTQESFEAYEKTVQESLPPADGGFATPQGGFTHLVVFRPTGDFHPHNPGQILEPIRAAMMIHVVDCGYFRTKPEDGRLIGMFVTTDPDRFQQMIESLPQFEFIRSERLTQESFEAYEKTPQLSLPAPRLLEIEQSDWFGKLNERQQNFIRWDENMFASIYDPANYDIADARDVFERRWLNALAGPEPGSWGMPLTLYVEAIFGVAKIKSEGALEPLLRIATERVVKDNAHRHFATKALGILGDPAAIPELIPLIYHFNMNVRLQSQVSLVRLTGQNFGTDAHAWGEWYMANRDTLGENLPAFNATPVDWTFGSTHPEIRHWADPAVQEESDARQFGRQ